MIKNLFAIYTKLVMLKYTTKVKIRYKQKIQD